ncbi:hypothetical protein Avbf_02683 [Armadillidium vulgare]|nr:hypothetical protein Avbf_02683 [Armadillidium vulgare]
MDLERSSSETSVSPIPGNTFEQKSFSSCCILEEDIPHQVGPESSMSSVSNNAATIQSRGTMSQELSPQQASSVHAVFRSFNSKGLQCSLCNKSFPSVPLLNEHFLSHPSDAIISCPLCSVKLAQRIMLIDTTLAESILRRAPRDEELILMSIP